VALSAFVPRKHNETGEKDCPLAVGALVLATVAVPVLRRVGVEPYPLSASLGLDQGWAMFAPAPSRIDGWYLVVGQKPDGSLVDVWRGRETLDTAKPDDMPAYFGSYLWRRLFTHLHDGKRGRTFEAAIPYFCRRWQGPLTAVAIEFKYEPTHVGAKDGPIESVPLFRGECPAR